MRLCASLNILWPKGINWGGPSTRTDGHTHTRTRTWRTVGVKSVITYYRTQGQTWHISRANYGSSTSTVTVTEEEKE